MIFRVLSLLARRTALFFLLWSPMSTTQTFASGKPLTEKYGKTAFVRGAQVQPNPHGVMGMVVGPPNTGKSYLFQQCKDAVIINYDQFGTVTPEPCAAAMWPLPNHEGQFLDPSGAPFMLSWEKVLEQEKLLMELASSKDPNRPRLIYEDSLTTMLNFVKDWVVRNSSTLGISSAPVDNWRRLDGRAAWDAVYGEIIRHLSTLHNAGYGVWTSAHIVSTKVQLGPDMTSFVPELTLGDGFWKRLFPIFELIIVTSKDVEVRSKKVEQRIPMPGRPDAIVTRDFTETVPVHTLTFEDPKYTGIVKAKGSVPKVIKLPEKDAWDFFVQQYTSSKPTTGTVS